MYTVIENASNPPTHLNWQNYKKSISDKVTIINENDNTNNFKKDYYNL